MTERGNRALESFLEERAMERTIRASFAASNARIRARFEPRPAFVYCIHDPAQRAVKIGWSTDPKGRLQELQIAHARTRLRLVSSVDCKSIARAMEVEREVHKRFAKHRLNGEWFDECVIEPEVLAMGGGAS